MATPAVKIARTSEEIMLCWEAMHALRPHLDKERFVDTVREMMTTGYHLAYIGDGGPAAAAIGYRFLHFLLHGKHIYIDDLTTLPDSRNKGYGSVLLEHVLKIAAEQGLEYVTLDSGPGRHDAHRLYLNKGFIISSYHFTRPAR